MEITIEIVYINMCVNDMQAFRCFCLSVFFYCPSPSGSRWGGQLRCVCLCTSHPSDSARSSQRPRQVRTLRVTCANSNQHFSPWSIQHHQITHVQHNSHLNNLENFFKAMLCCNWLFKSYFLCLHRLAVSLSCLYSEPGVLRLWLQSFKIPSCTCHSIYHLTYALADE